MFFAKFSLLRIVVVIIAILHLQPISCLFQGDRDETNKVNEKTAETDAEDLYEVSLFLASVGWFI